MKKLVLCALVLLGMASLCKGDTIMIDNYESYANTLALRAAYPSTANVTLTLSTTEYHSGGKSMFYEYDNGKDPWFAKAERQIARDLLKLSTPVRLEDFASLADLSELKAFKTLELLFRTNYKDPTDKFAADALYYNSQYLNELEALPIITLEGANVSGGGGLSRRS